MGIIRTLAIGAVGYVLGARAGRERYEKIKDGALGLWDSKAMREGRAKVRDHASDTFASAQEAATAKFHEATEAIKEKVRKDDEVVVEEVRIED